MRDVVDRLKRDFRDPEYRHVYDEGFLNSSIATQLKVLREERGWTQAALAEKARMNQSRVSELEDVNFNSWTIRTLRKFARAFDLRLKISFEEFGTLLHDFRNLNRRGLSRRSFDADPEFGDVTVGAHRPTTVEEILREAREPVMTSEAVSSQWLPGQWWSPKNQITATSQTDQTAVARNIIFVPPNPRFRKGPKIALELKNEGEYYSVTPSNMLDHTIMPTASTCLEERTS